MKTLQLKTLPLLLLEIPNSAKHTQHSPGTIIRYRGKDCELIGKLSELSEEWFERYVTADYEIGHDEFPHLMGYIALGKTLPTPLTAFYHLLESKEQVYLNGNPMGTKVTDYLKKTGRKDWEDVMIEFKEAQSRTLDPDRTYLFRVKTEK